MSFGRLLSRLLSCFRWRAALPVGGRTREGLIPSNLVKVQVSYVLDGDTVDVVRSGNRIRIRLDAIDCPEDGQEWGDIATAGLIKMIGGRSVYLETHGLDPYLRTLATIYVERGSELINVNERMVMLGHAWVLRRHFNHLSERRKQQLNRLENWAKSKRVGLWKTKDPLPPWKWRRAK